MKQQEAIIGIGLGVLAFLIAIKVNVWPVLLLGGLGYFLYTSGGQIKDFGRRKVGALVGESPNVRFEDVGGQNVARGNS